MNSRIAAVRTYCEKVWGTGRYSPELCPADDPKIHQLVEVMKRKDGGKTRRAIATTYRNMEQMLDYFDKDASKPVPKYTPALRLWWESLAQSSFILWTRLDELLDLRWKHVEFLSEDDREFVKIEITFRKTNQSDPNKGNVYKLPDLSELEPATNPFKKLNQLRTYFTQIPPSECWDAFITGDAFVFPKINVKTGEIQWGVKMDQRDANDLLQQVYKDCGIIRDNCSGTFTSHTFRRGGAQHRLAYSSFVCNVYG